MIRTELARALRQIKRERLEALKKAGEKASIAELVRRADHPDATEDSVGRVMKENQSEGLLLKKVEMVAEVLGVDTDRIFRLLAINIYRRTTPEVSQRSLETGEDSLAVADLLLQLDDAISHQPRKSEKLEDLRKALAEHYLSLRTLIRTVQAYLGSSRS